MKMRCPVCNSSDVIEMKVNFKRESELLKSTSIFKCEKCELIFLYPLSKRKINEFYKSEYRKEHNQLILPSKEYINGRRTVAKERLDYILGLVEVKGQTLLDIGCSDGSFLHLAKSAGFKTYGIEPNVGFGRFAKEKYGLDVETTTLDNFKRKGFDIITLWHVFEHFYNPLKQIKKIYTILNKGGLLIINVPNTKARLSDQKFPVEHYFHYDLGNLSMLAKKFKFKIVKAETNSVGAFPIHYKTVNVISKSKFAVTALRPIYRAIRPLLKYLAKQRNDEEGFGKNLSIVLTK